MKTFHILSLIFFVMVSFSCSQKQETQPSTSIDLGIIPASNKVSHKNKLSELEEVKIALRGDMDLDFYTHLIKGV